jgi:hypothetical protein
MRTLFVVLMMLVVLTVGALEVISAHRVPEAKPLPTNSMMAW